MGDRLSINVFCNEGVSIVETERGKVSISASEFLAGWQGKPGAKKTTPLRAACERSSRCRHL